MADRANDENVSLPASAGDEPVSFCSAYSSPLASERERNGTRSDLLAVRATTLLAGQLRGRLERLAGTWGNEKLERSVVG